MVSELHARLSAFIGIFLIMALWETARPLRPLLLEKWRRWGVNLSMMVLNTLIVRLLFSTTVVNIAAHGEQQGWGILYQFSSPVWLKVLFALLALDLIVYLQHLAFHAFPFLWRLHMVHHSDLDFDLTTGIRFHPLEILISFGIKGGAVVLLGASPLTVILFEIILNGTAMFNHSNISLPGQIDRWVRYFLVTPDMHRVHHSVIRSETNSNFGFNLPWWDRFFRTYHPAPRVELTRMTIGLTQFPDPATQTLPRLLALPFSGSPGEYPIFLPSKKRKPKVRNLNTRG
ncbi:MAG TPA: sterol desaturase family protein [Nitrospiria bacterium]|nr:sterol desaturase family protein [Nitrospiria bacterium]